MHANCQQSIREIITVICQTQLCTKLTATVIVPVLIECDLTRLD